MGSADQLSLTPTSVQELAPYRIVDIAAGDAHCLALTDEGEVYAWGTNTMGQCGQNHTLNPIRMPLKVMGLSGIKIRQITAGMLVVV